MLLSTKSKGHKSNVRISLLYRFCFFDLKVHFWWPNKCLNYIVSSSNTLHNYWRCSNYAFFISLLVSDFQRSVWSVPSIFVAVLDLQKIQMMYVTKEYLCLKVNVLLILLSRENSFPWLESPTSWWIAVIEQKRKYCHQTRS